MPTESPRSAAAHAVLSDDDAYTAGLADFITASPTSYHAAAETAARLNAVGFSSADETQPWGPGLQRCGYAVRDGAIIAWILPERCTERAGFRIVGAHTDSPALKLKPRAAMAQVAPHLDRSVNDSLRLDKQAHLLPLWSLAADDARPGDPEHYLCELAGIDPDQLAFHDILTFPTEPPSRFGRHREFLAASRLDNLSSVHAALAALEAIADGTARGVEGGEPIILVANDHEEVGSQTRSGAGGPFLETVLGRLAGVLGINGDARAAMLARSICVSADAGHAVHPGHPQLHDPAVRPALNRGPLVKINAQQRYATDAVGTAVWLRACAAADVPVQDFVSNNTVPCGTTIGPITAARLGITTVDIGQPLLSMHSQREMCGVADGLWMARAMRAFWLGA